jgi:hypothetical protein
MNPRKISPVRLAEGRQREKDDNCDVVTCDAASSRDIETCYCTWMRRILCQSREHDSESSSNSSDSESDRQCARQTNPQIHLIVKRALKV